jgi:hypothetical protein
MCCYKNSGRLGTQQPSSGSIQQKMFSNVSMNQIENGTSAGGSTGNLDQVLSLKNIDLLLWKEQANHMGQVLLSMLQKQPK